MLWDEAQVGFCRYPTRAIKLGRNHGNSMCFNREWTPIDANFQNQILRIRNFIQATLFIRVHSCPFAVEISLACSPWISHFEGMEFQAVTFPRP